MKEYALIIRTDSYAGNFERELCAHLTGCIGDCEVGEEYKEEKISLLFEEIINNKSDDNGCFRPVSIGGCKLTSNYSSNDVVIWFNNELNKDQLNIVEERLKTFNDIHTKKSKWNNPIQTLGIDMLEIKTKITITKL